MTGTYLLIHTTHSFELWRSTPLTNEQLDEILKLQISIAWA